MKLINDIDVNVFKPMPLGERRKLRSRLGLPVDGAFALFVGRLVQKKGFLELILGARSAGIRDPLCRPWHLSTRALSFQRAVSWRR